MQYAKKAELFARRMHKGQVDKGGNPYILHPQAVADGVAGDRNKAVAWLHDVLEDCDEHCDEDVLKSEGFPDDIIQAVKLLTHRRWVPYQDYIHELSSNPMAKSVIYVIIWISAECMVSMIAEYPSVWKNTGKPMITL
jgi:(p)ppGpp synthase/HD superfamily hydrolase